MEAGNTVPRVSRHFLRSAAYVAVAVAGFTSLIGCGSNYRPVVAAINPVGPSSQPTKYAIAISSPSSTTPGLVTIVDFSGDTVLITANIGADPKYLVLNGGVTTSATTGVTSYTAATTGYTINGDNTLNSFDISTSLISSQISEVTLLAGVQPVSIFPQGTTTYVTQPGTDTVAEYQGTTSTLGLKQQLNIVNPIYVVGITAAPRVYALSQGDGTTSNPPLAVAIDSTSLTPTASIPVGSGPVYGIMTGDGKRVFVMNKTAGTVSVINAQTNALDTFTPTGSTTATSTINVGTSPLWADFASTLSEMVVANAGSGTNNGTLSIISIPLCSAAAQPTNPNCDSTNPVDAAGFGTVLASPTVGVNPIMVSVLQDGTRAYVANAGDPSQSCTTTSSTGTVTANGNCTVSVVNLKSNTVTATIPIAGHPAYIAATTGTPTGKVYVVCNDSQNMTVIRTDIDAIDTTIPLQGNGVSVRVTLP